MNVTTKQPIKEDRKLKLAEVYLVPSEDGLSLRTPLRTSVLRGKLVTEVFPLLLPKLDGTRTAADLKTEMADQIDETVLAATLDRLIELGMIEPAPDFSDILSPELRQRAAVQDRFFRQFGGDDETMDAILTSRIVLAGEGPLMASLGVNFAKTGVAELAVAGRSVVSEHDIAQSIHLDHSHLGQSWGRVIADIVDKAQCATKVQDIAFPDDKLGWQHNLDGASCAVLALDMPVVSVPWVEAFNAAALATSVSWTSASMEQRSTIRIGPAVIPHETACWKCFEFRFKSNIGAVQRYEEFQEFVAASAEQVHQGNLPSIPELTASLLAFETMRMLAGGDLYLRTAGTMLVINLWELGFETHPVLKLPRCPHCSPVSTVPRERMWS